MDLFNLLKDTLDSTQYICLYDETFSICYFTGHVHEFLTDNPSLYCELRGQKIKKIYPDGKYLFILLKKGN